MVIVLDTQTAVTPVGKPIGVPIPVASVVVWFISVNKVFIHKEGEEVAILTVFNALTIIVPIAFKGVQPPVIGIV